MYPPSITMQGTFLSTGRNVLAVLKANCGKIYFSFSLYNLEEEKNISMFSLCSLHQRARRGPWLVG